MSSVRAVVFDLFDTLVDLHFSRLPITVIGDRAVPSTISFQHRVMLDRGHAIELQAFAETLRETDRELHGSHLAHGREVSTPLRFSRLAERLGIVDPDLPELLTRSHMGRIREVAETPPHHAGVLRDLRGTFRLGLCSNFSHAETALSILEEGALARHLDALAISETAGVRKPRPEIFRGVLEALAVSAEEAVHVGDSLEADVRGASEVGMRTIWVHRRVRDPERALREYGGPPPTWAVGDLAEIAEIL